MMQKLKFNRGLSKTFLAIAAASGLSFAGGFFMGKSTAKKPENIPLVQEEFIDPVLYQKQQRDSIEATVYEPFMWPEDMQKLPSAAKFFRKAKNELKITSRTHLQQLLKACGQEIHEAENLNDADSLQLVCKKYQQIISSGFAYLRNKTPEVTQYITDDRQKLEIGINTSRHFISVGLFSKIFTPERLDEEKNKYMAQVLLLIYNKHAAGFNKFVQNRVNEQKADSLAFEKDKQQKIDSLTMLIQKGARTQSL